MSSLLKSIMMNDKEKHEVEVSSCDEVEEEAQICPKPTGKTVKRKYVLNDSNALKKKVRNESRSEPFTQGTEARDGSNVVILLKTSFFEHMKQEYIKDLTKNPDIEGIGNALGSKAASTSSGEAFVEFSFDISFKFKEAIFKVKLTAYTTTCKIKICKHQ